MFTKNIRLKIVLLTIGIFLFFTFYSLNNLFKEKSIENELSLSRHNLKTNYEIVNHNYTTSAKSILYSIVKNEKIIDILSKSLDVDDSTKKKLRKELYSILKNHYNGLKETGIKLILFSEPDNKVFLRVHKPDIYNDDITNVRYGIDLVNKTKQKIIGFEAGKISHAFRNIFPIYNKKGNMHVQSKK